MRKVSFFIIFFQMLTVPSLQGDGTVLIST